MSIEKERIQADYSKEGVPGSVQNFRPDIYKDDDVYYCILGAGTEDAIIASGSTIEMAMQAWDIAYKEKKSKVPE